MISHSECPQCHRLEDLKSHWQTPRFLRCPRCGLITQHPFPTAASLASLYKDSWEAPDANTRETGATDPALAGRLLEAVITHLRLPNLDGKRVLDFGAGRGAMASELKRRGADVVCVEPFGCEYLARLGISTYTDLVDLPPTLRLDGIVCLEV